VSRLAAAWPRGRGLRVDARAILGLAAGYLCLLQFAELPPMALWALLLGFAAILIGYAPKISILGWFLLGLGWTGLHAHWSLAGRFDTAGEGGAIPLVVAVEGLPVRSSDATRFYARVLEHGQDAPGLQGRRVRLAWYGNPAPEVFPGEHWRLHARLRSPRGTVNPGGFDSERFALQRRIAAVGSVAAAPPPNRVATSAGMDALRDRIAGRIGEAVARPSSRFLQGLAVGDTRGLKERDWEVLRATGLSHLLAISGLHVGLVAGFAALWMRLVYRLFPRLGLHWPRPLACALAALLVAAVYALLAGFGLPTQRSLLMLAAALLAVLLRRRQGVMQSLLLAGVVVWAVDPLAPLGAGFWLSFLGVFWLLLCVPAGQGLAAGAKSLFWAQLALGLGLLPLTIVFFGQSSLVGLVLNLAAVPWVSLAVVPPLLLGVALLPWPSLSVPLLQLAGWSMQGLWWLAETTAGLSWAQAFWPEPGPGVLLLAVLGVFWLLLPRGVPGKPLAALCFLPLLWPAQQSLADGELRVDLLDVGQGQAVLLRTREHALLYDAGPRHRGGFDAGEAVVLPALRAMGVKHLDVLMISHADSDHAGGTDALRRNLPITHWYSGEPERGGGGLPCRAGHAWHWNGVDFTVLHPPMHFPELGNESSCVLEVTGPGGRFLLPGDIGEIIERRLQREGRLLPLDVLLSAHHGSRSGSTAAFLQATRPRLVLVSAGYRNRFGHPHPDVIARYRAVQGQVLNTAHHGHIRLRFRPGGEVQWQSMRMHQRRFWRAAPAEEPGEG